MKNRFYTKLKKEQLKFQFKLLLFSLLVNSLITCILYFTAPALLFLIPFFVVITLSVIAPFFDVPSMVGKGHLRYFSSLFLAEKEKDGVIVIHGGTLFDYYFAIPKNLNGKQRTAFILSEYLKGLLNIIHSEGENVVLRGTSYIINERTASKTGLKKVRTDGIQQLILLYNYFNLVASLYLAKNKIIFPRLSRIHTYEGKIGDLKRHEASITTMLNRLTDASDYQN
ncbi:hypothetical protein [Sinomicrobium weinanense]|uniref:Uncharacterized protein n=1 Tax=Sinomicrobium weinanense TaxID=2842200 RepID=A0A926JT11_9FLAO|nr:hypothetical protein [Sinomicrobium weinanense]MBC9796970.1 hypothetical protein [Sinomicrobium weinanense]MBU3122191.1 hypothetical protein [Sinomicrobium weinanense]